jgi:HSP20 family molecular chaperone IbpA
LEETFPEMKDVNMLGKTEDDKKLEISLDTSGYKPDELKVQVRDGELCVEGRHEEKSESGHVMVSRKFCRRFGLPQGAKKEAVESNLSQDGVMVITVPKDKKIEEVKGTENIPVEYVKDTKEMKRKEEEKDHRRFSKEEVADSRRMETKSVSKVRESSEGRENKVMRDGMIVPMTLRDPFLEDPFFKNSLTSIENSRNDFFKKARDCFEENMKQMESKMMGTEWMKPLSLDSDFDSMKILKDSCEIRHEEDDSKLEVHLDTVGYKPDELKVEVGRGVVSVEGKHEERSQAGQVMVSKQFSRQYTLPQSAKEEDVVSSLSKDGVLVVTIPKHKSITQQNSRNVPIMTK